ncbi:MAG: protealysin inhibitor emfourin [Burkholderiales bacterium]
MKISFIQSGGFAGLIRGCEVSAADLPKSEQKLLARLLAAAGLERMKPTRAKGADRQQYEIAIERDDGSVITVTLDDSALTDAAAPLVAFLRARSKPVPIK